MINNVVLGGRLTADLDLRFTQAGTPVGNFTLAVERPKYNDRKETDFINCVLWGKSAEALQQWLTKGKPIAVIGSIQTRKWEDQNGNKRTAVEVKVDRVSFLPDSRKNGNGNQGNSNQAIDNFGGQDINFDPDDVPF